MGIKDFLTGGAPTTEGGGADPDSPDLETLKQEARKAQRGGRLKAEDRLRLEQQAADLDALYEQENWEEIAALYFEARFAITGFEGFRLSDGQKKTLAASLATMMRVLIKLDPGYVAVIVFTVNFGALITRKELAYRQELAREEAASGDERPVRAA